MKKLLLLGIMFGPMAVFSQDKINYTQKETPSVNLTMKDRYKADYELLNESLLGIDSLILYKIEPILLDALRKESEDITITHKDYGFQILIYSKIRAQANKAIFTEPLNK